jgi:histidyl-tRNA synthetase
LFLNFSEEEADQCTIWANAVRDLGKVAEVYPSQAKLQKQLKYANDKGVKWVLFYGEEERQKGIIILKQMESGEQYAYSVSAWLSSWEG